MSTSFTLAVSDSATAKRRSREAKAVVSSEPKLMHDRRSSHVGDKRPETCGPDPDRPDSRNCVFAADSDGQNAGTSQYIDAGESSRFLPNLVAMRTRSIDQALSI